MTGYRTPSRQEISKAVGGNPDMTRALEKIFQFAVDIAPEGINGSEVSPGGTAANELADRVDGLISLIHTMTIENRLGEVLTALDSLRDLALTMPAVQADDGMPSDIPPPNAFDGGANGTFTTADPYTVTVVNGIITNIA